MRAVAHLGPPSVGVGRARTGASQVDGIRGPVQVHSLPLWEGPAPSDAPPAVREADLTLLTGRTSPARGDDGLLLAGKSEPWAPIAAGRAWGSGMGAQAKPGAVFILRLQAARISVVCAAPAV
jgi:hypothetical protein